MPEPTPKTPLLNPNTSIQPTSGASVDPANARVEGLGALQLGCYDRFTQVIVELGRGVDPASSEDNPTLAAATAAQEAVAAGGDPVALETAADAYESALAMVTATLGADLLSRMNACLTDMRFMANHMRPYDVLPALPPPTDEGAPGGEGEGEVVATTWVIFDPPMVEYYVTGDPGTWVASAAEATPYTDEEKSLATLPTAERPACEWQEYTPV